jgi:fatty-acyl-CoA synthase
MISANTTLAKIVANLSHEERGFTFVRHEGNYFITFKELRDEALVFARGLRGADLRKGDRIITILPQEEQFIRIFLGAVCSGIIPVPIFPPFMLNQLDVYRTHLERVVRVSGASAIITSAELRPLLEEALDGFDATRRIMTDEEVAASAVQCSLPLVREDDIALLQFTSGSTGSPRGVCVTHRALLSNIMAIAKHIDADPDVDRGVSWLPLYHDMGLGTMILSLVVQGSIWYISPLDFVRRPQVWCETISSVKGSIGFSPNFGYALLARRVRDDELAEWDLSSWRVAGCGAEPIQPAALRSFAKRFARAGFKPSAFLPSYGMAEATLAVSFPPLHRGLHTFLISRKTLSEKGIAVPASHDEPAHEMVGCGQALAGHELAIIDVNGRQQPDRHEGEIVFRGPSVTTGYYRDAEATAESFRDGWLHTHDLGFVHDGDLFVTGRKNDLIIFHGRNYYPQDIEWCVQTVRGVRQGNIVAFGYPNEQGDDAIVVVVEAERRELSDDIVGTTATHVRAQLGIVIADTVVVEKNSLPKTSSGKLRRARTKAEYLSDSLRIVASLRRPMSMAGTGARAS